MKIFNKTIREFAIVPTFFFLVSMTYIGNPIGTANAQFSASKISTVKSNSNNFGECLDCAYAAWDKCETEGTERVSWVGSGTHFARKLRRKDKCVRVQLHARMDTKNNSSGEFILVIERGGQKKQQLGSGNGAVAAEIDYFFFLSADDTNDEIKVYATDIKGGVESNAPANYCDIKISYATPN